VAAAGSVPGRQDDAKSRFAAHHALIALSCPLQRQDLGHRPHTVSALKARVSCESIEVPESDSY
jgi:hypothetical protein